MEDRRRRIENALWGLFAGDALAMPAHWFYSLRNLREQFDGGLKGYEDAPHPHPESFMVGMKYRPDVAKAEELSRPYDVLHEHARFYDTSYGTLAIERGEREGEHGNATPKLEERFHYHHGLKAGENTTAANLVEVLMDSVLAAGRYEPGDFLEAFVAFMTKPGRRDPYLEIYLRRWFENFAAGKDARDCAEHQREIWSIGSHGGMIRPLVLSMLFPTSYQGLGFALEHQVLTHRSENVAAALGVTVPLLADLVGGRAAAEALEERTRALRVPSLTGRQLHKKYREANGPGNIPDREMWELHTWLADEPEDLVELAEEKDEGEVVLERFGTVCYPEHGLPLMFYLALRHGFDPAAALLANANAGGDNVHRGAVLGTLVGAACEELPEWLKAGLVDRERLAPKIAAFAELAARGGGW